MVAPVAGTNVQSLNGYDGVSNQRDTKGTTSGLPFSVRLGDSRAQDLRADRAPAHLAPMPPFKQSEGSAPRQAVLTAPSGAPDTPIAQTLTAQVSNIGNFTEVGSPASSAASAAPAKDTRATSDTETASQTTSHGKRKGSSLRKKLHTALKFAGAAVMIGGAATAVAAAATALATPVLLAGLGVAIGGAIVLTVNHFTRPAQA